MTAPQEAFHAAVEDARDSGGAGGRVCDVQVFEGQHIEIGGYVAGQDFGEWGSTWPRDGAS